MNLKSILAKLKLDQWLVRMGLWSPLSSLWRVARRPQVLRYELALLTDYWRFRQNYFFVARNAHYARSDKKVLIINLSDFVAQVKRECMLAEALRGRGYTPVILSYSWLTRAFRYFRVFGLDDFVFFDHYLQPASPQAIQGIDDLLCAPTFQSLKEFRYRDIEVGRQVLATMLRHFHVGKIDMSNALYRSEIRRLLTSGVQAVDAAEKLIDEIQPEVAIVNDALYVGVGAVFDGLLRRGIGVIQWVGSQRDDALVLKRFGWNTRHEHPFSLSPESWQMARQMTWTPQHEQELLRDFEERYVVGKWTSYANRQYGKMKNKTELEQQLGLDPRKKTAVVFPHILWDSTLFWGEDLFDDYEDWFVETVRAARDNCAVNWVVKLHPGNVWKLKRDRIVGESIDRRVLREKIGELPAHIHLLEPDTDISTFALFDVMDYCLTVRGTVGIEAAAFGIPVFTGGTGRYSGCGFTVDSTTRAEFLSKLAHIQDIPRLTPTQTEMAKKYAFALFIARPARFQSFHPEYKSLDELGHPLDHNVRINVRSAEEFARAADLQEFARWVESGQADFLSEGFL